jgi:hypothetical protein
LNYFIQDLLDFDEILELFDEEEKEEYDIDKFTIYSLLTILLQTQYLENRVYVHKSQEWFNKVLPHYDNKRFKKLFRMTPQNFYKLSSLIETHPIFSTNSTNQQADVSLQLAVFLRRLAIGDIFSICALFGVAEGTVILYTQRVLKAILSFKLHFVKWPKGEERQTVLQGFKDIGGFYNIIGSIDGTHIILTNKPPKDPEVFFNRKKCYSIQVQAIVNHKGIFTNYLIGWPGSVHDARVYTNSLFYTNRNEFIKDDDVILGDSAYPISSFLISPFRTPQTQKQKDFNYIHSKHRIVVEHAFGRLKARFVALQNLNIKTIKLAVDLTDCAMILHNFLELNGEMWEEEYMLDADNSIDNNLYESDAELKRIGEIKRNYMMELLNL